MFSKQWAAFVESGDKNKVYCWQLHNTLNGSKMGCAVRHSARKTEIDISFCKTYRKYSQTEEWTVVDDIQCCWEVIISESAGNNTAAASVYWGDAR